MAEQRPTDARSLASKLNRLFVAVHPQGRGEYTHQEVADALRARGGPTISATYVWQLRNGLRDNPTKKHLEALADFFGVPAVYFFDDPRGEEIDAELELLVAIRQSSVRAIALRATGLSSDSLRTLAQVVERVRQLEGLTDSDVSLGKDHRP